jgi:stage V sporulation protein G
VNITEAKIKFVSDKSEKLRAFCSITIDHEFVIRDIKIIEGAHGCFIAMPSRKLMDRCPACGGKNHLRAAHCNDCGKALRPDRVMHDETGRAKLHADVAHPINATCRERLQRQILDAYEKEVEKSRQPGYVAPMDDEDDSAPAPEPRRPPRRGPPSPPTVIEPPPPAPPPTDPDSFSGGLL